MDDHRDHSTKWEDSLFSDRFAKINCTIHAFTGKKEEKRNKKIWRLGGNFKMLFLMDYWNPPELICRYWKQEWINLEAQGLAKSLRQSHFPYAEYFAFSSLHLSKVYDLCLVTASFSTEMHQALYNLLGNIGIYYPLQQAVLFKSIFSSHSKAPAEEDCREEQKSRSRPGFSHPMHRASAPFCRAVPSSRPVKEPCLWQKADQGKRWAACTLPKALCGAGCGLQGLLASLSPSLLASPAAADTQRGEGERNCCLSRFPQVVMGELGRNLEKMKLLQ